MPLLGAAPPLAEGLLFAAVNAKALVTGPDGIAFAAWGAAGMDGAVALVVISVDLVPPPAKEVLADAGRDEEAVVPYFLAARCRRHPTWPL